MTTPGTHTHHGFDYLELSVTDMEAAKAFYARALGWAFTDYADVYAGIRSAGGGDGEMGGLLLVEAVSEQPSTAPLAVLYSTDLETSMERVRNAGGVIVTEPFGFPGGRRFHFQDPDGNVLAVWAAAETDATGSD